ncbi:MAG TPA: hypothetical protein VK255_03800 [Patescibacteria group bacterium]|nr:hypothetical protein [Patescibacteria group bacterium]
MVLVYLIIAFFSRSYATEAFVRSLKELLKLLPLLLFVYIIIFAINLYLKPETIKKHLGHDSGMKGWLYALLGSILISAPPYVAFPMLKELRQHGMRYSFIAVFMNNRHVQPAMLPVMAYYFGLPFTITISIYILIFAVINGKIIGKFLD